MKTLTAKNAAYDEQQLLEIFAPRVVAMPPVNATRELMRLPDASLRFYHVGESDSEADYYIGSFDNGLSWKKYPCQPGCPGATTNLPGTDTYLTVRQVAKRIKIFRSETGPDGNFSETDLRPFTGLICRPVMALRQRHRLLQPLQEILPGNRFDLPGLLLSDDAGMTWRTVHLPSIPPHVPKPPHKGLRWITCGSEPSIAELPNGRLYMIIRTSQDFYYESWSTDAGDSWSEPQASPFYGTATSPMLLQLSSNRLLLFGNLSSPLPELDHSMTQWSKENLLAGWGEDVFTNRDVLHAMLSDDNGTTWHGFRELHLNELRNAADFRNTGGHCGSNDRSVHQVQACELPHGKVLVAFGQHPRCRRMLIFDPQWLLEKERSDDFSHGLDDWCVHQYVKSRLGGTMGHGTGHCAYNRRPGAGLVPHPEKPIELLQIARFPDPRLVEERQGAVWNFPLGRRGKVTVQFIACPGMLGTSFKLLDHWVNPADLSAANHAQFEILLDEVARINGIPTQEGSNTLEIMWDIDRNDGSFLLNGGSANQLPLRKKAKFGINYLHIQSTAKNSDPFGVLIESVAAEIHDMDRNM